MTNMMLGMFSLDTSALFESFYEPKQVLGCVVETRNNETLIRRKRLPFTMPIHSSTEILDISKEPALGLVE